MRGAMQSMPTIEAVEALAAGWEEGQKLFWSAAAGIPAGEARLAGSPDARGQAPAAEEGSCLRVEVFTRADSKQGARVLAFLSKLERRRAGIRVEVHDVGKDPAALRRLRDLATSAGAAYAVPTVYACGRLVVGFRDDAGGVVLISQTRG